MLMLKIKKVLQLSLKCGRNAEQTGAWSDIRTWWHTPTATPGLNLKSLKNLSNNFKRAALYGAAQSDWSTLALQSNNSIAPTEKILIEYTYRLYCGFITFNFCFSLQICWLLVSGGIGFRLFIFPPAFCVGGSYCSATCYIRRYAWSSSACFAFRVS